MLFYHIVIPNVKMCDEQEGRCDGEFSRVFGPNLI